MQVQLEEEINIKANTLKIDEVDCMTLRESMAFHSYWPSFKESNRIYKDVKLEVDNIHNSMCIYVCFVLTNVKNLCFLNCYKHFSLKAS
jgi:hypothetical protein